LLALLEGVGVTGLQTFIATSLCSKADRKIRAYFVFLMPKILN
jgi:hypothetical protein